MTANNAINSDRKKCRCALLLRPGDETSRNISKIFQTAAYCAWLRDCCENDAADVKDDGGIINKSLRHV
jgi:hypothetical protein